MRRVKMADIAKLAGVSPAAVSLALRDSAKISETTREKIRQIAVEQGYVYNREAAQLRTATSTTIAICLHTITNPIFSSILTGAKRVLWDKDWTVIFGDSQDLVDKQEAFIARAIESNIAGLIVSPAAGTQGHHLEAIGKRIPLVVASREVEARGIDLVHIGYPQGIEQAVGHLYELGHRNIGWIGRGAHADVRPPGFAHFVEMLRKRGIVHEPHWSHFCSPDRRSGYDGMRRLLASAPELTAVLCFSDLLAIGAMRALHEVGMTPGRDMSVIGFDDLDEAFYTTPPLTSVRIELESVGRTAAELLLKRISSSGAPRQRIVLPPKLVIRQTTAAPRDR